MSLINMGKSEGPQIIQLFGRGVRLKGKDNSLKREVNPDYNLKILQTLFIFGLNADYINTFLATLEKEEIDYEELKIPIKFNRPNDWENKIYTIKTKDDFDFLKFPVKLTIDNNILGKIKIDLRPKITLTHGINTEVAEVENNPVDIPDYCFNIIDWQHIYSEIMNYKIEKTMYNLIVDIQVIKDIIKSKAYQIFLKDLKGITVDKRNSLIIESFEGVQKFHDILLLVLKDYIQKFYRKEEKRKSMDYLEVEPLTIKNHSHMFPENGEIIIKIPKRLDREIKSIVKQIEDYNSNKLPSEWQNWSSSIIHFDNHLYTPLIIWDKSEIKSIPVKLNEYETKFLKDLKDFLNSNKSSFKNMEIFLLRNLSKRGIGFFLNSGFYPDFIIWINKKNVKKHIIFIDPKGIRNLGNFNDEKIQICTHYIKEIEKKLKSNGKYSNLQLDAFILSITKYDVIKKTWEDGRFKDIPFDKGRLEFEKYNILFKEYEDYLKKVFNKVI